MKIKARWFDGEHLIYFEGSDYTLTLGNEKPRVAIYSNGGEFCNDFSVEWDSISLWTGLKNRDGKELYCGDIVKCDDEITVIEPESIYLDFVCYIAGEYMSLAYLAGFSRFEIIGNIYENPELLENEH